MLIISVKESTFSDHISSMVNPFGCKNPEQTPFGMTKTFKIGKLGMNLILGVEAELECYLTEELGQQLYHKMLPLGNI